ncbi:hypothetical protein SLA2020_122170 [Shorea laevis]
MDEIDVPPFFLCPISLEIMKDPVTVTTGITYDRESIEKWLYSGKNTTCPVTKQVISDTEITPNHTLRRLIQSWCTLNASYGIERIPTPKPPINKAQIAKILSNAKSPQQQIKCLHRLQSLAAENDTNKRCMEAAGAVDFLATIVISSNPMDEEESSEDWVDSSKLTEEALSILYNLQVSEAGLKNLLGKSGDFLECLTRVMERGTYESRAYAALLLKSLMEVADPMQLMSLRSQIFVEAIQILHDNISQQASKAILHFLINVCPWGRNKIKAVEAGGVSILIDLLLDSFEKRMCEMILTVLEMLSGVAEGRAELVGHAAGLAVVSKKILRISHVASERAVRILLAVAKFSATPIVLQEMLQIGVVAKLCLVLQMDCNSRAKEMAREVLKLHAGAWKNSPCMPMNPLSSFPA